MQLLTIDATQLFDAILRQASSLGCAIATKDEREAVVGMNATVARHRMIRMRPR
jgi:hypothetical protein